MSHIGSPTPTNRRIASRDIDLSVYWTVGGSEFGTFAISAGQMFHIKSGSLHYIENLSNTESAEFIHCIRHEKPEDFSFGAAIGAMTPAVLGNASNLQSSAFSKIKLSTKDKHIVEREGAPTVLECASLPNHHKYDVEAQEPVIKPPNAGENITAFEFSIGAVLGNPLLLGSAL